MPSTETLGKHRIIGGLPSPETLGKPQSFILGGTPAPGPVASGPLVPVGENALAPDIPGSRTVAITYSNNGICSGVLVGHRHVLTAGHCGCDRQDNYAIVLEPNVLTSTTQYRLAQPPILFDPRACREKVPGKDLALLILDRPFVCDQAAPSLRFLDGATKQAAPPADPKLADCRTEAAQSLAISAAATFGFPTDMFASLEPLLLGRKLTVIGYGYTDRAHAGIRMQVPVPIKSIACTEPELAEVCSHFAEMILADAPGPGIGKDSCGGDSGGPVFLLDGPVPKLVAITSRGAPGVQDDPVLHCGGGGIYTIVGRQSVHDWLTANGVPAERQIMIKRR